MARRVLELSWSGAVLPSAAYESGPSTHMKRSTVVGVFGLCAFSLAGCKKELAPDVGSGVQKSEKRVLPEFRKVKASGTASVEIAIGAPCEAEITTDDNLLALVTTTLRDGVLEVRTAQGMRPRVPVRVRLCAAALDAVIAEGASQLSALKLAAQDLVVRAGGGATMRLTGSAAAIDLRLGAASRADLSELSTATTTAHVDQAASARLGHTETLNVTISGPGSVRYRGEPTITRSLGKLGRLIQER
jgi:hypothetical protein